jgi:hypothetical protein
MRINTSVSGANAHDYASTQSTKNQKEAKGKSGLAIDAKRWVQPKPVRFVDSLRCPSLQAVAASYIVYKSGIGFLKSFSHLASINVKFRTFIAEITEIVFRFFISICCYLPLSIKDLLTSTQKSKRRHFNHPKTAANHTAF